MMRPMRILAPEVSVRLTRRLVVRAGVLAALSPILGRFGLPLFAGSAYAQERNGERNLEWRHGLSLFGELKYPAGFKHFDYVNPNAPKGGSVRLTGLRTFDNLNTVVALVKGNLAGGVNLIYD